MKRAHILTFVFALILTLPATAQQDKIKDYINDVVQNVENLNDADEKRVLLNESFDKLITVFEKVENMNRFSDEERFGISELKKAMADRKNELNGENGFTQVPNNQLNNFANFVQQDIEQADTFI